MLPYLMKVYLIDTDEEHSVFFLDLFLSDKSQCQFCYVMTKILLDKKIFLAFFIDRGTLGVACLQYPKF